MHRHTSDRLYCLDALRDVSWGRVPVSFVPVSELVPTQGCLVIDRLVALVEGEERNGDDEYGHVIRFNDKLYIHDGHHAWALRWLRGDKYVPVRIQRIAVACVDPCCQDCGGSDGI